MFNMSAELRRPIVYYYLRKKYILYLL